MMSGVTSGPGDVFKRRTAPGIGDFYDEKLDLLETDGLEGLGEVKKICENAVLIHPVTTVIKTGAGLIETTAAAVQTVGYGVLSVVQRTDHPDKKRNIKERFKGQAKKTGLRTANLGAQLIFGVTGTVTAAAGWLIHPIFYKAHTVLSGLFDITYADKMDQIDHQILSSTFDERIVPLRVSRDVPTNSHLIFKAKSVTDATRPNKNNVNKQFAQWMEEFKTDIVEQFAQELSEQNPAKNDKDFFNALVLMLNSKGIKFPEVIVTEAENHNPGIQISEEVQTRVLSAVSNENALKFVLQKLNDDFSPEEGNPVYDHLVNFALQSVALENSIPLIEMQLDKQRSKAGKKWVETERLNLNIMLALFNVDTTKIKKFQKKNPEEFAQCEEIFSNIPDDEKATKKTEYEEALRKLNNMTDAQIERKVTKELESWFQEKKNQLAQKHLEKYGLINMDTDPPKVIDLGAVAFMYQLGFSEE